MFTKIVLAMVLVLGLTCPGFGATRYVAAGSAGGGASWSNAYGALDAALAVSVSGDTVLIAAGKYIPSGATFTVPAGVTVKGGYSNYWSSYGTTTGIGQYYNPSIFQTVLSGDTNGDDAEANLYADCDALDAQPSRADNKVSIMTLSGDATVDGCTFWHGGAVLSEGNGPGILCSGSSTVTVNNCQFLGCTGNGSIYPGSATATITNCYFYANATPGGIIRGDGTWTLSGCTFKGNSNSGEYSNGVYWSGGEGATLTVNNCLIVDSVSGAVSTSGSMYLRGNNPGNTATISNCVFTNDHADTASTYFYNRAYGAVTFSANNCLWVNCAGHTNNGTIGVKTLRIPEGATTVNLTNVTIADNQNGSSAGVKADGATGSLNTTLVINIKNSILWGNTGAQVRFETSTLRFTNTTYNPFKITYCCIDTIDPNNYPAINPISGIPVGLVAANPQFVGGGDYHLQCTSPCIDNGDPASSYANEPKWLNGCRVNMGAYGNTKEAATTATCVALSADITGDCKVNTADLLQLRTQWLKTCP